MPTTTALAQTLKALYNPNAAPHDPTHRHVPRSRWFRAPSNGGARVIPRTDIAAFSDDEYLEWCTVHPDIQHTCDMTSKLHDWLRAVPVDELARLLDTTPSGCVADDSNAAFEFTPNQRLFMAVYTCLPFDVTSTVKIDTETLRRLAKYREYEIPRARAQPIQATYSMLQGSFPSHGIVALPTACGKTALSLCMGFMAVADAYYPCLVAQYRNKRLCEVFQGSVEMPVARLVLVATTATTFDHFATTLQRLLPTFRASSHRARGCKCGQR